MNIMKDVRYAFRVLLRRKGYAAVVVCTLAIGIGASTTIFSFVNGILLQPLPFFEPDQLVIIESVRGGEKGRLSQREIADIKENTSLFEDIAGYNPGAQYNLTGQGEPEEIPTTICSSNLFSVLGADFLKGKAWPEEFDGRRAFGVVLTEELWKRKFNADASYLNGTITLDAYPEYNVFGVLPAGFDFPKGMQMYRSASWFDGQVVDRNFRDRVGLGRIRKDTDLATVQIELEKLAKKLSDQFPETNGSVSFAVKPLTDLYVGGIRPYLILLSIAVLLVLIIACVNVSNLILSAGATRDKEVAIRTIMGAARPTLISQFLTESLVLSLAGGLIGVLLAWALIFVFKDSLQKDLPHWLAISIDIKVLTFTFLVALCTGIIAGLMPALKISGLNISRLLKESKGSSGGQHRHRVRKALVIAELSLSLLLLIGTGLLLKSFDKLKRQELGFNPDNVLTYRVALPWRKYGDMPDIHPFYKSLIAELKKIPGVQSVALNDNLPLSYEASQENRDSEFTIEGQSFSEQKENPYVKYQTVNEAYFRMLEIPLIAGRFITDYDDTLSTPVAVINQTMAKKMFPKEEALNKRLKFGKPDGSSTYRTIVGIVGDVRHDDLRKSEGYHIYLSNWQRPEPNQFILIKTEDNPMNIATAAIAAVARVDGDQSIYDLKTMVQRIDQKLWQDKLVSTIFSFFSVIAMLLAGIGIYSVMTFAISQRTKELGVRRVLGATSAQIIWMVQKEVLILVTAAVAIGAISSVFISKAIHGFLYGVELLDIPVYLTVTLFLVLVSVVAALIPSWRAILINPVKALKND